MKDQTTTGEHHGGAAGMKDKVSNATEQVKETASHVATDALDKGEHLMEMGKEKAQEIGAKGEAAARSRAETEKHRVATGLRTFADALRHGSEDLDGERDQFRPLLSGAADRAERLSTYLESQDINTLTSDIRRFADEHKSLFAGSAFAIGFLGTRLMKSSMEGDEPGYRYPERTTAYERGEYFDSSRQQPESRYPRDDSSRFQDERATYSAGGGRQGGKYE